MSTISISPSLIETTDASGSTSTKYKLLPGQSAQGYISFVGDQDYYEVDLVAGQTYTFAAIGTGANFLSDAYLRLVNAAGSVVSTNDDGGPGTGASLTFTATTSGVYYLDVSGYPGYSITGQYGVSVTLGSHASYDLPMAAASEFQGSTTWSTPGTPAIVTYGFRQSGTALDASGNPSTFSQLSAAEMATIKVILSLWSDVCNITFVDANPGGYTNNATILFGNYYSANDGAGAYANYPGSTAASSSAGDVWLNLDSVSTTSIPVGSYSFFAIMHEIGHAIGLSHPGDYNASPTGQITYSNSAQFLQDTEMYSVMSYFDGSNTGQSPGNFATAYTPMLSDIYELQLLYGANLTTRNDDTIYGFNTNTDPTIYGFSNGSIPLISIWDAGGNDTLDCSGYSQNQIINLNQGAFSNIGGGVNNVSIAVGAIIENAIGGSGNDVITGNSTDNRLFGNAGNDVITGGGGNDYIDGGSGINYACYQFAMNFYRIIFNASNNSYEVLSANEGDDTLINIEYLRFASGDYLITDAISPPDFVPPVVSSFSPAIDAQGVSINSDITITFSEVVELGTGHIIIYQGSLLGPIIQDIDLSLATNLDLSGTTLTIHPNAAFSYDQQYYVVLDAGVVVDLSGNTYTGGICDFTTGSAPLINILNGTTGVDTLTGGAGNDVLIGLGGVDKLDGKGGSDIYVMTATADHTKAEITDTGTSGTDEVRFTATTASTLTLYAGDTGIEQVVIGTGTGAIADTSGTVALNVNASAVVNGLTMIGNAGVNTLTGTAYNDIIDGGAGADTMVGGKGDDTYYVDNTGDKITEAASSGTDTVYASVSYTLATNVENLILTGSSATNGTGNTVANTLTGNSAANVLNGLGGNDLMDGGDGSDIYLVATTAEHAVAEIHDSGTSGIDELRFTGTSGTVTIYAGDTGLEAVTLGTGTAAVAVTTATSATGINASAAVNGLILTGNNGANSITGTAYDDVIYGNSGNDTINGGNGNDTLYGGLGNDTLTGGSGNDHFVFDTTPNASSNKDTITDFSSGTDKIDLSKAVFTALGAIGTLSSDEFYAAAGAVKGHDGTDRIIYNTTTGALYYDADGSGSGAAIQIALLGTSTHPIIAYTDFSII